MADQDAWAGGQPVFEGLQQQAEVGGEDIEAIGMTLFAVGQQPVREALATPIMGQDGVATRDKLADNLQIFLDEFTASATQHHRAARVLRREQRRAQSDTASAGEPFRRARWRGHAGRRIERRPLPGHAA